MVATTKNELIEARKPDYLSHGVPTAGRTLYQGTICFHNAADGTITDLSNSGANPFAGIVKHMRPDPPHNNPEVEFYTAGVFTLPGVATAAQVGAKAYAVDNFTASPTATNNSLMGVIRRRISATHIEVDINKES